jgi:hypothetical protein
MGVKQLKEQNPDLNINIIDVLSKIDNTKTKKLMPFLIKLFKNKNKEIINDNHYYDLETRPYVKEMSLGLCDTQRSIILWILDWFIGFDDIENIPIFVDYLERGLIDKKDISTYQTMDDMVLEIGKAATKEMLSKDRKNIMIVHDDDEWMFLKPLTYNASVTYGYGTKWCTSMKNESDYFYRYSREGVLIYVINKITGKKFGIHSNNVVRMGIFDETDKQIDSFETDIPKDLMMKLFGLLDLKNNQKNYELFSDEEKAKCDKLNSFERFMGEHEIPVPMEEVMNEVMPMPDPLPLYLQRRMDNHMPDVLPLYPNLRIRREEVVNRWVPELDPNLHDPTDDHNYIVRDLIQQQISDMMFKGDSAIDDLP